MTSLGGLEKTNTGETFDCYSIIEIAKLMLRDYRNIEIILELIKHIEKIADQCHNNDIKKLLAELHFLAYRKLLQTDPETALTHAKKSIDMYKKLNINTLEESVPILWWLLPSYMHEGVVKYHINYAKR